MMNKEEFRKYGHIFVDWMADYYENLEDYSFIFGFIIGLMQICKLISEHKSTGKPNTGFKY